MASILIIDDNDAVRTALEVLLVAAGASRARRELAGRRPAHAREGAGRPRPAGHELPQGGHVGRRGRLAVPRHPRALPDGTDRAAHGVDASGNGRRSRQGRRRGLRREALGRCATADDDPQSAGAAALVGRAGASGAASCRVARRAGAEVRPVRPRVRERGDARCGHEGHAHRRRRRAGADHRAERLGQGSAGGDHPGELESCAAVRSSRSTSARCRRI